ncbi:Bug family tripartite tricarboxylate transporter substrate binding protein [Comamonas testosteroni]|uniref:Bug family tripartite tricarboxylate transporter substrate binding protein n=1 Tax=Comamonas testosteroni TaxID=285 RepID=UPI00389B35C4
MYKIYTQRVGASERGIKGYRLSADALSLLLRFRDDNKEEGLAQERANFFDRKRIYGTSNMTPINRRTVLSCAIAGAAAFSRTEAAFAAEDFPTKPLRLIVSVPPGGTADVICRLLAEQMAQRLKFGVVVDNRPGAVGLVALQAASSAPSDGHTLVQIHPGMIGAQLLMKRFDMLSGLSPLSMIGDFQLALFASGKSGIATMSDFKAAVAKPGANLSFGTLGVGSYEHLLIENLLNALNANALHIPYKGGAETLQALVSGQIDFAYLIPQLAYPYIAKSQLRPLAVIGDKGNKLLGNTPTFSELGLPVKPMKYWIGLCAMQGVPENNAQKLHNVIVECMKSPSITKYFNESGAIGRYSESRIEFKRQIIENNNFLKSVILANDIKIL